MEKYYKYLVIIFILIQLFLLSLRLNEKPLFGHSGWNYSRRGIEAVNYERYGYFNYWFAPVENIMPLINNEKPQMYLNHPPLTYVFFSIPLRIANFQPWLARIFASILTIISFLFLYQVTKNWRGLNAAISMSVFFSFIPLILIYGNHINHEPLIFFGICGIIWIDSLRHKNRSMWQLIVIPTFIAILIFTDWPGCIFIFFWGVFLFSRQLLSSTRDIKLFIVSSIAVLVSLGLLYLYFSNHLDNIRQVFEHQYGARSNGTLLRFIYNQGVADSFLLSFAGFFFIIFGLINYSAKIFRLDYYNHIFLITLFNGISYIIIFKQGAFVHDYWIYYLSIAAIIASGEWWRVVEKLNKTKKFFIIFTVLIYIIYIPISVGFIWDRARVINEVENKWFDFDWYSLPLMEFLRDNTNENESIVMDRSIEYSKQQQLVLLRKRTTYNGLRQITQFIKQNKLIAAKKPLNYETLKNISDSGELNIFGDYYYIFDRRKKMPFTINQYCIEQKQPSLWWNLWVSRVYPPYTIKKCYHRALNYALALEKRDEAERLMKELKKNWDNLNPLYRRESISAYYNYLISQKRTGEADKILTKFRLKSIACKNIAPEIVNWTIQTQIDGRILIQFYYLNNSSKNKRLPNININFIPQDKGLFSLNKQINSRLENVIPDKLWKKNYIYLFQNIVDLPFNTYQTDINIDREKCSPGKIDLGVSTYVYPLENREAIMKKLLDNKKNL